MRTAIFIDGAYLDFLQKEEFGKVHLDLEKLPIKLANGKEILRTYYYHCLPYQSSPSTPEEQRRFSAAQRFYNFLSTLGRFQTRLGILALRGHDAKGEPIFVQKKVDILMGVDLALLSGKQQISEAILLAGDSDFIPAVEAAKSEGVLIKLYHGNNVHRELWSCADERTLLDADFIQGLTLPQRTKK